MHLVICFLFSFWLQPLYADNTLAFKKELIPQVHWLFYSLLLGALLVILLFLGKYLKKESGRKTRIKLVEKLSLHHKTKVYIIAYQEQQFLITDNQNALAIHSLKESSNHE